MAMGHVILKEFYFDRRSVPYFDDYARRYTDLPMLVMLKEHALPSGERVMVPDRYVRASRLRRQARPGQQPRMEDRRLRREPARSCCRRARSASAGARDGRADAGQWNLEAKEARHGRRREAQAVAARGRRIAHDDGEGRLPVLRRHPSRAFPEQRRRAATCWCARCRCSASRSARRRRRGAGRHRVRPAGAPTTASRAAWPANSPRRASTTTRPTRRPGRSASPACRATR